MLNIESIRKKLNCDNISYYSVKNGKFSNRDDVMILECEKDEEMKIFKDFIEKNNVEIIFYSFYYYNENYFLIKEEDLDDLDESVSKLMHSDIKRYNEKINKLDFERAMEMEMICIYNNQKVGIEIKDYWCDEHQLIASEEMLDLLEKKYTDKIDEIADQKREVGYALIEEFEEYILNDPSFLNCTNQDLRKGYIYKIFNDEDTKKYEAIFSPTAKCNIHLSPKNFIEIMWKTVRNK